MVVVVEVAVVVVVDGVVVVVVGVIDPEVKKQIDEFNDKLDKRLDNKKNPP